MGTDLMEPPNLQADTVVCAVAQPTMPPSWLTTGVEVVLRLSIFPKYEHPLTVTSSEPYARARMPPPSADSAEPAMLA